MTVNKLALVYRDWLCWCSNYNKVSFSEGCNPHLFVWRLQTLACRLAGGIDTAEEVMMCTDHKEVMEQVVGTTAEGLALVARDELADEDLLQQLAQAMYQSIPSVR